MFSRVKTIIFNLGRIGSLKLRSRLEKTYPLFHATTLEQVRQSGSVTQDGFLNQNVLST